MTNAKMELLEIELFDHLTMCEQKTDVLIELFEINGSKSCYLTYAKLNC